jgi:hypothetical protein
MATRWRIQKYHALIHGCVVFVYREQDGWTYSIHGPLRVKGPRVRTASEAMNRAEDELEHWNAQ